MNCKIINNEAYLFLDHRYCNNTFWLKSRVWNLLEILKAFEIRPWTHWASQSWLITRSQSSCLSMQCQAGILQIWSFDWQGHICTSPKEKQTLDEGGDSLVHVNLQSVAAYIFKPIQLKPTLKANLSAKTKQV